MALPDTRDADYGEGNALPAATVNALQDAVIAHEASICGAREYGLGLGFVDTDFNVGSPYTLHSSLAYLSTAGVSTAFAELSIPICAGERLKSFTFYGNEGASGGYVFTVKLWKMDLTTGTQTQIGSTLSSPGTDSGEVSLSASPGEIAVAGYRYWLEFTHGGSGQHVNGAKVTIDIPFSVP